MFFLKTISVFCVAALLLALLADLVVWSLTMVVGGIGIWAKSPSQLLTLLTTFLFVLWTGAMAMGWFAARKLNWF